jgi:hypothetical protein
VQVKLAWSRIVFQVLATDPVLCCAVLCCAVLCCAVLCCAVLCCAVLCCAVCLVLLLQFALSSLLLGVLMLMKGGTDNVELQMETLDQESYLK